MSKAVIDDQIKDLSDKYEISLEEATQMYLKKAESVVRLEDLKPQRHNWVERGVVVSCENGDHPNHRYYKKH